MSSSSSVESLLEVRSVPALGLFTTMKPSLADVSSSSNMLCILLLFFLKIGDSERFNGGIVVCAVEKEVGLETKGCNAMTNAEEEEDIAVEVDEDEDDVEDMEEGIV